MVTEAATFIGIDYHKRYSVSGSPSTSGLELRFDGYSYAAFR